MENQDFFDCSRNDDKRLAVVADNLSSPLAKPVAAKTPKALQMSTSMEPLHGQKLDFFHGDIGDICGLTYDVYGNIVVLHRGDHRWDGSTFSWGNEYR